MLCLFHWKYIIFILMIYELIIIAVHMFNQGFLLNREPIITKSTCEEFKLPCTKSTLYNSCLVPKYFNKTILLIIDALRYDFATYDASIKKEKEKPYENKLKVINDILISHPKQSLLLKLVADPPTTTMQRLKGLTTGSLPTFIDAAHNFGSAEIVEDNIIDQMKDAGMKIVALGDDTWGELFPNRFHRSHLFPSFNVKDLDTVDNGILAHLEKEIKSPDADFILAHFLGVDHCGHRYGPHHPQMEVKLKQMNDVIKNVSRGLSKDSLLLVIGDHGMTPTGNHGGDSKGELETVFFMYSPSLNLSPSKLRSSAAVPQIDFVPTLAFLLGIPIPYSNLGKIFEEVLEKNEATVCSPHDSLYVNYLQVNRYLNDYQTLNSEFPQSSWENLSSISQYLNTSEVQPDQKLKLFNFLTISRLMCEEIWAKFGLLHIVLGLISFICMILIIYNFLPKNEPHSVLRHFRHILFFFLFVNTFYGVSLFFFQTGLNFVVCLGYIGLCIASFKTFSYRGFNCISLSALFLMSIGSFSNSFVVMEDLVTAFLLASLLGVLYLKVIQKKLRSHIKSGNHKLSTSFNSSDIVLFCCILGVFLCLRFSRIFLKCREEQYWCDLSSMVHIPLSGLAREFHNTRYLTSLISLLVLVVVPQIWLQLCGNLNGGEVGVVVSKKFPILSALLVLGHWALQSVPSVPGNISKIAVYLPRSVFFLTLLGVIIICYNPLLVYTLPTATSQVIGSTERPVIPQLFMKLKETYDLRSAKTRRPPIVYGLATAVTAPMVVLLSLIAFPLVILAGDGMAPGILLLLSVGVLSIIVLSFFAWNDVDSVDSLLAPNWCSIATWFFLSIHGFYTTGHQASFSTLSWFAAFESYDGTESHLIPASMIIGNTFSSQIFFGISVPLLLTVPLSIGFLWPPIRRNKVPGDGASLGEFLLIEHSNKAKESLVSSGLIYIGFHSFKVLFTSIAAFLLRRHLMVWKIFAPHFIFEAVGLIVSCTAVVFGLSIAMRVISVLEAWSKRL